MKTRSPDAARPTDLTDHQPKLEPGYDYVKEIARGGYGCVYLFTRKKNGVQDFVAGKFVYRDFFGPAEDSSSAAAYGRALEGLNNFRSVSGESPYLLRIFDVRQRHEEGYFCYMMELADDIDSGRAIEPRTYKARTLKSELERDGQRRRLPVTKCVDIAIMLGRGLRVLHESGFTHRDVRPSNIIFVKDVPKLADIDLLAGNDANQISYIPKEYAAPEGSHSTRADIFSLGKTLYEMCTGLSVKAFPTFPPDIRHWPDHQLMLKLNKVIGSACARELRKRYESVEPMLDALEAVRVKTAP